VNDPPLGAAHGRQIVRNEVIRDIGERPAEGACEEGPIA
jgi:hypothetical protein